MNERGDKLKTVTQTEIIFKHNLKKLRKSLPGCLNKSDTARKIGISPPYYINLESEKVSRLPSFEILEKISTFYDIPVYKLFYFEE